MTVADMAGIAMLEQPALSPDGKRVALVVERGSQNSLVLVATSSGKQTIIARGGDVADPRWSADGTALAYLQRDRSGGRLQLFVASMRQAPLQLTRSSSDVIDMAWPPHGRTIAYAAAVAQHDPGYFDAGDNDYTATSATPPVHLFQVASAGGAPKQLTRGTWTLPPTDTGGVFSPQFAWSADGKSIVFTRVRNTFSGDDEYSTLWNLDVASGKLHKLTRHAMLELSPSFSPDGSALLYAYARGGEYLAFNTLRLRRGSHEVDLTANFDYNVGGSVWMPDGRSLLVCANDRTRANAWTIGLNGAIKRVPLGDLNIVCDSYQSSTFDSGIAAGVSRSGALAFLASSAHHPRELFFKSSLSASPHVLTHFNDAFAGLDLGKTSRISWRGRGGFAEYGVLTYPPHMSAGRKYPIVVSIHGGPGDSSLQNVSWEAWPRAQLFASNGYIVFEPNYRGSDDAGNAFALAIYKDTVSGPADDILRGLAVVRRLPQADSQRVAVCGWSYGGLLTSWLITQHHFWRTAISGAAVNDEIEEYALSTSNVQNRYYLGTSPYAKRGAAIYVAQSPITYAARVTTPTLLWATTLDPVVPIPQMYSFYHALHEHHVPVRFLVFPAPTHGPVDAAQTATLSTLWLQWLDRYLQR